VGPGTWERPLKISFKSFPGPGSTDSSSEVKSHLPDIKLNLYGFHFKQLWNYTACPLIIGGFKVTFFCLMLQSTQIYG